MAQDDFYDETPGFDDEYDPSDDYDGFDDEYDDDDDQDSSPENNITKESFPEITKRFESVPHKVFLDTNYYKTALTDEGESAKRVNVLLQKYVNSKDPKDRSVFRAQIIGAYWEVIRSVAKKTSGRLAEPKKFLLRFNMLHPNMLDADNKNFFAKLVTEDELKQPVYYLDEWFKGVGTGKIKASTTDEAKGPRGNSQSRINQLLQKAIGKLDGSKTLINKKDMERQELEISLKEQINVITEHFPHDSIDNISCTYSDSQKRTVVEVQDTLKSLLKNDREMNSLINDYFQSEADVNTLRDKAEENGGEILDLQAIDSEFDTIRQAAKMTIGRQGNHFPLLTSEYFHCGPNDVGFRENVVSILARIESIDPEAFNRYYKNRWNRIVPYIVLLPTYGDMGICWEPFDKHNRATSRGRVMIPMYPKNLYAAVLSAVADLRWQVAKEKASYYWMEEGLTGYYYKWFSSQKIKGNIKDYFIQDYILWMTKEAEGIQKLEKEVRNAFWRWMPFAKDLKEKLGSRSYVYQELCQRDKNREMSDGY